MSRYYNSAALRGGWSYRQSPALRDGGEMPTPDQITATGQEIFNSWPVPDQTTMMALMDKKGVSKADLFFSLGLLSMLDALKIMAAQAAAEDVKRAAQVRYRLLKDTYRDYTSRGAFVQVRRIMHPPLKRAPGELQLLRAPATKEGKYLPYMDMRYYPSPPKTWKIYRGDHVTKIPVDSGTWSSLPAAYRALPKSGRGWSWTEQKKAFFRQRMQAMQNDWKNQQKAEANMGDVDVPASGPAAAGYF